MKEFLNGLIERTKDSVIGETVKTFVDYYRNNRPLTKGILLISGILSLILCGAIAGSMAVTRGQIGAVVKLLIPFYAIRYALIPSIIVYVVLNLVIFRLIAIFGSGYTRDRERKYNVAKEGSQGTATFMTEAEQETTFVTGTIEEVDGDILGEDRHEIGKLFAIMEQYGINRNMLVVGSPGSGKSRCLVINMILQTIRRGESAVITDPKGELFSYTSRVAKQYGYKVRLISFNPQFMHHSDSVNYMKFIKKDSLKAQSLAYTILMNTNDSAKKDFWDDSMMNLLTALLLYVDLSDDIPEANKNLPYIYELLTNNSVEGLEGKLGNLGGGHPATAPFRTFMNGDKVVKGNTLTSLAIRLQCFNAETVKRVTSADEVSFTALGEEKCIYYVGSSDQDSSMDFLVAMFFTVLFQELVALADSRPEMKLKVKTNFILDEFKNIGIIPDFKKKLSTVRSRGINTTIIIQGISQIEEMYPNNAWYEIVNDCSIQVLLQTNDPLTAEFFSNRSGEQTTLTKNKRYSESVIDILKIHPSYTVTESESSRMLLTKHEILTMDIHDILVIVSTRNVIKMRKYDFSRNPMAEEIEQVTPLQHMPRWMLLRMHKITPTDDYDSLETDLPAPNAELPDKLELRGEPHGVFYQTQTSKYEKEAETDSTVKQKTSSKKVPMSQGLNFGLEDEVIEEEPEWDLGNYSSQEAETPQYMEANGNNPVQEEPRPTTPKKSGAFTNAFKEVDTEAYKEESANGKKKFTNTKKY